MKLQNEAQLEEGVWAILELFGHRVVAGKVRPDESFGAALIRVDVPGTEKQPEYTRHYNPAAIYSISYVSEEVARLAADAIRDEPVSVYVPELSSLGSLQRENLKLREMLGKAQQLPAHIEAGLEFDF